MAKVELPDYPDNSDSAKVPIREERPTEPEEKKEVAVLRKKPLRRKVADTFLDEDRRAVGDYILGDVVMPSIKNTISDVVTNGIDMLLFGTSRGSNRGSRASRDRGYKSYNKYSSRASEDRQTRSSRRGIDIDDVLFPSRGAAERAYDYLLDRIEEYDYATVADLMDKANITPDWTAESYGWEDLPERAHIERTRYKDDDGDIYYMYILILPKPYRIRR